MGVLDKIPIFLITGVLVIIFVCLKHHARSGRLKLWTIGWTLVFTHFLAQLLEGEASTANSLLLAIDGASLQAAAAAFLISVSSVAENSAKASRWLAWLAAPAAAYAVCASYSVQARWPYAACLAVCFGAGAWFLIEEAEKLTPYYAGVGFASVMAVAWTIKAVWHGSFHEGAIALTGIAFCLAGALICFNQRWASPAALTIAAGLISWGMAFPLGLLLNRLSPSLLDSTELWDTPKIFVALGMILAVVETKSESIAGMQYKAERLDRRLERFSAVASQLLGCAELSSVCPAIAAAITEVSTFSIAVIQIEDSDHQLRVAGASGLTAEMLQRVNDQTREWTIADIKGSITRARLIGKNSYVLSAEDAVLSLQNCAAHHAYGEELIIPLCSDAGAYLGCIRMAAPRDAKTIHALELLHIEMLATDIALAIELQSLQTQLVWSGKLAALGQLLAGVAHELNNPLTAIMGYGELINDAIVAPQAREQMTKLVSEARRMNRMIDNMLRFSRQGAKDTQSVQLAPVLDQVLALREFHMRKRKIQIEVDVAKDLPQLAIHEDEIKQILLNLFTNSCDAMENTPASSQIKIRAYQCGSRAVIEFADNGPGFANLSRALEPFYTTKPVGKGTGLGLSVCYGIVKKRGGDLEIENAKPHGARVRIILPVAEPSAAPMRAAMARA